MNPLASAIDDFLLDRHGIYMNPIVLNLEGLQIYYHWISVSQLSVTSKRAIKNKRGFHKLYTAAL